jgi:hypothetical protein
VQALVGAAVILNQVPGWKCGIVGNHHDKSSPNTAQRSIISRKIITRL